jgi:hypothetical protein
VITSGATVRAIVANPASGTCAPPVPGTRNRRREFGSACQDGSASSTTRYWFDWPKIVEICRWPNASYNVSWIACIDTPSRIAASRSTLM